MGEANTWSQDVREEIQLPSIWYCLPLHVVYGRNNKQ
jgi:hypothetical protein